MDEAQGLLRKEEEGRRWTTEMVEEGRRLGYLAAPMVAVMLSQYLVRLISTMVVGHLGELALSSASIATSLSGVTGFSLLMGMASALETLCGQAYGAQQYHKLSIQMYRAMFCLILICIPISILWLNLGKLMVLIRQDPIISQGAENYSIWLIPALFAYAFCQPIMKFLQAQGLIFPMLYAALLTLCLHLPVCWILVFQLGMGNAGAALANGVAYIMNVVILGCYVMYADSCKATRALPSMEIFEGISEFLGLALSSSAMICIEWWSWELLVLLSGLLPNPKLETSVLSICLNSIITFYAISCGLGAAASTRVSNELGAGNPRGARGVVCVAMLMAITEALIISVTILLLRNKFGYAFSNELEVVAYANKMVPLIAASVVLDNIVTVLSGIARGCGWQHLGAYINLGAFYLFGIPISVVLGFFLQLRGEGLWIGILSGAAFQAVFLVLITVFTDWGKQVRDARERVFGQTLLTTNI